MTWLFFAICSIILITTLEILMRVLAIKSDHYRTFSLVFNSWASLFALIAFLFQGGSFTTLFHLPTSTYILLIVVIILYGLYERFQFIARKGIDASSLSIVNKLSPVIGFFGGLIFLGEPFTIQKCIGVTLTISATFVLLYKNKILRLNRSIIFAIFCSTLIGVGSVIDKPASANISSTLYSFLIWFLPLFIIAFPRVSKKQYIKEFRIGGWKVALAALVNVVGYICFIRAITLADASRVIPITSTTGIFTVLGGIFLLGEHDHMSRKITAAFIAFIGILLLI